MNALRLSMSGSSLRRDAPTRLRSAGSTRPDTRGACCRRFTRCGVRRCGASGPDACGLAPSLAAGSRIEGPAVIEEPNATTLIHPGDVASVTEAGHLVIDVALDQAGSLQ